MDFSVLNQTNQALTHFGNTMFQIGADMKRQEDERNRALGLLEFHTWATDQTHTALRDLNNRSYSDLQTDAGNLGDKTLDDLQTAFTNRVKGVKDQNLAIAMQRVSDGLILDAKNKYLGAFEAKKKDHFLGVYQDFDEQQFNKVVSEFDPKKRAEHIAVYESGLLDLVNGGVMKTETATKERLKFRSKVDAASADMLINSLVPGSTLTPDLIEEKLKDPGLFPYLTIADRAGKIHKLYDQAKTWRDDVRKEAETDALQNVYDVLGTVSKIEDSGMREKGLVRLENMINEYAIKRTLTPEKREHLRDEILKLRAGKSVVSDPEAKLELTEAVATGRISIKGISSYPGVSADDKDALIKYKHSLDSQSEAIGRAAANQQRSFDIAERNRETERAIAQGKYIITGKGPLANLNDDEAYQATRFVRDVLETVKKGGSAWDVVDNIHSYTGKDEIPFISVPTGWSGRPQTLPQIQNLKTWVGYYQRQGKIKEANILSEQIKQAQRVIEANELNAKQRSDKDKRRTR
jgi:hypothetical protein